MKKISKISSIIISYIANIILIAGSVLLTIFLIKMQSGNSDLGEGIGKILILLLTLIIFIIGIVLKLIILPITIKHMIEISKEKSTTNTKWMIVHIVDYAIAVVAVIYLLVVIIRK